MSDATLEILTTPMEEDELRYQLDKRSLKLNGDLDDLIDKGLVERVGTAFQAVVPKRPETKRTVHDKLTDEALLDRVRLWALIVGKPPTAASWDPSKLDRSVARQVANLRKRVETREQLRDLYEAGDWPSFTTIERRFGSLNAALVIAGFEPRNRGGQPSELRPVHRPGPKIVREAMLDVDRARESSDSEELKVALYQLAVAALTEADRITTPQTKAAT